jgi:aspartyl-tRNA synthetase
VTNQVSLKSSYRSHTCGELRTEHVNERVTLSGWLMRKRDHGGVVFIDLRDTYGVTQVVVTTLAEIAAEIRPESVVQVVGVVVHRAAELVNPKIATGQIELRAESLTVLSPAETLPFLIAENDHAPEATRLTYRFLDLRRDDLHRAIHLRGEIIRAMREIMHRLGFYEFQTPILTSSSPEGARDFIVPSRLHPGKFYALPQAPQMFKQLLMVSGFDRYFQIAPCFRDEDARADRSPGEFYQLDMELSFAGQEEVFAVNEALMSELFGRFSSKRVTSPPFPRITHAESMARYGSDKPDLRNPLVITAVTDIFTATAFKVFRGAIERKESIRCLKIDVAELPPRSFFDETIAKFLAENGMGLAYLVHEGGELKSSIAKFFSAAEIAALKVRLDLKGPAYIFFAAGPDKVIQPALGRLRTSLGERHHLIATDRFEFLWVTDFPLYEADEAGTIEFAHNPFSMPQGGLTALETKPPLEILASQYDLVCNGYELASGAVRNHIPEVMYRAFEIAGHGRDVVDHRFGGMIRAFRFGAPPHAGIAPGVDRVVMLLAERHAIRDVVAFPMNQAGEDLLMGAPSTVSERQLREAHIAVRGSSGSSSK